MRPALILMTALLFAVEAHAFFIEECGTFIVEGRFVKTGEKSVVLLDRGAESEFTVELTNKNHEKFKKNPHDGVNYRMKLKIESKCWHHCKGEILEIISPLNVFKEPSSFMASNRKPVANSKIECKPQEQE